MEPRLNGITRILKKCCRNYNVPDLHSFTAKISNGIVHVDCGRNSVSIDTYTNGDLMHHCTKDFRSAITVLFILGMDCNTVEI